MLKIIIFCLCVFSNLVLAITPQIDLEQRLNKVNSFSANFLQKVVDPENENLMRASGTILVKRPNLFKWETLEPEENLVISNGEVVWFYNPFVEQVTITWLSQVINGTPLALITKNKTKLWEKYNISRDGDQFSLIAKDKQIGQKLIIRVDKQGRIENFAIVEQDGQKSNFELQDFNSKVNTLENDFEFNIPDGVELDDQRD